MQTQSGKDDSIQFTVQPTDDAWQFFRDFWNLSEFFTFHSISLSNQPYNLPALSGLFALFHRSHFASILEKSTGFVKGKYKTLTYANWNVSMPIENVLQTLTRENLYPQCLWEEYFCIVIFLHWNIFVMFHFHSNMRWNNRESSTEIDHHWRK